MRKIIVWTAVVAIIAVSSLSVGTVRGQNRNKATTPPPLPKSVVGLIDMAHVFKEYKKFEAFRASIKLEIERSQQQAEAMKNRLLNIQKEMQMLKDGSPEYSSREKEYLRQKNEYDIFRRDSQRSFLKRESQLYKTVYLEVTDAVQQYCDWFGYTIVIRFNRKSVAEAEDPREVLSSMNRQVVFYQKKNDITLDILKYLNFEYERSARGSSKSSNTRKR